MMFPKHAWSSGDYVHMIRRYLWATKPCSFRRGMYRRHVFYTTVKVGKTLRLKK